MGYRSQVSMALVGPAELMINALITFRLEQPGHYPNLCKEFQYLIEDAKLRILLQGENWKWYEGYEDVDASMTLFRFFESQEHDQINGAFARIGEDDCDIETSYFGDDPHDLIGLHRSIDSQYKIDPTKPFGVIPEWKPTLP